MILANLAIPLVGAVDTAMMGRLPDARHLGAVAVGAAVMNALYWMVGFLRMGTNGLTAQALGASDQDALAATAVRSALAALGLGMLFIIAQLPLIALAMRLFQASQEVEDLAAGYLAIRVWGAPALLLYLVCQGALFGLQRMRIALAISLTLNFCNVVLDLLFVIGFDWGVQGVATGTVISEWLAAAVGLAAVRSALAGQGSRWPNATGLLHRAQMLRLFRISANLVVRTFFVQLPFFLMTALGAGFGDVVLAANAVLMLFMHITAYGLDGFAQAAETLAGYAYGRRDPRQLRQASAYSAFWAGCIACLFSAAYYALGEQFIALATLLPEVRATASEYLPWVVALPWACIWAFMLDGIFIGATRTKELRNATMFATGIYLVILWLSFQPLGNHGLWLSMFSFMALRGLTLGSMYPALARRAGRP